MNEGTPSTQTPPSETPGRPAWQAALDGTPAGSPNEHLAGGGSGQGGASSGQPATPVQGTPPSTGSDHKPEGAVGTNQSGSVPAASPAQIIQMDDKTLKQLLESHIQQQSTERAAAAPVDNTPAPTQEELDKLFNVYKPATEHLQALGIEATPERVAIVSQWLQGAAKQAASVASFQLAHVIGQLKQELAQSMGPVLQQFQEQRINGLKERFFTKHPDLKGVLPLIEHVRNQFVQAKRQFATEEDAFKAVAEETHALVKSMGIKLGETNAAQNAQNQNGPGPSRMPTLSGGGQGGAGDGSNSGQPTQRWQRALS